MLFWEIAVLSGYVFLLHLFCLSCIWYITAVYSLELHTNSLRKRKISVLIHADLYIRWRWCHLLLLSMVSVADSCCRATWIFNFPGSVETWLRWEVQCRMGFVANFIRFSAVQKFWKSVNIWQSYKEFKGGNFLRHSVVVFINLLTTIHHIHQLPWALCLWDPGNYTVCP